MNYLTDLQTQDENRSICFFIHQREVLRLCETADGKFHVQVPEGVPMTQAAEDFVTVLQNHAPILQLLVGLSRGNA